MSKELEKKIAESGNNLHIEVVKMLENDGWEVEISPYYYDDTTDKPREIDIIAKKEPSVFQPNGIEDYLHVYLCIECKYLSSDIAFWMRKNRGLESKSAVKCDVPDSSISDKFKGVHHYIHTKEIAKLYDVAKKNGKDPVYDAFTQSVKALIHLREKNLANSMQSAIYYPIVVYDGTEEFRTINIDDKEKTSEAKKEVIYGFNYSYRSPVTNRLKSDHFYVDFMHKDKLIERLNEFENVEVHTAHEPLKEYYQSLKGRHKTSY